MVRLIDFPEIREDIVGAVLQLKHNGASTQGTVIFFHLFLNTAPASVRVAACSSALFKPKIYF